MPKQKKTYRFARLLQVGLVLLVLSVVGWRGWVWQANLRVQRITVAGAQHADRAELLKAARVDTGQVLFDIDPALVADRLRRHPWVRRAEVDRRLTGTLVLQVAERTPVALAVDRVGTPSYYLDRWGYAMPAAADAVYDVPLLRGLKADDRPTQPVQNEQVQRLLAALTRLEPETEALVSGLHVQPSGDVALRTAPAPGRGALRVRLGQGNFGRKLRQLRSFWHQAVLPQPKTQFAFVDLRFDGQIVTKESKPSAQE